MLLALRLLRRHELRRRLLLHSLEAAAARMFLARLFARLSALFLGLTAIALRLLVAPSAVAILVLRKRGRSRGAGQENGDQNLTHDGDFLEFPDAGNAPFRLSGG
jgi:hypothetical protein